MGLIFITISTINNKMPVLLFMIIKNKSALNDRRDHDTKTPH